MSAAVTRAGLWVLVVCATPLAISAASAHVTLEPRQASVAGYAKLVFAVPHGCDGSATTKVRVQIPEGVIAVKPMPKPGWSLDTIKGSYVADYELHGKKISAGVKEVVWSGGKLLDDNFDEFAVAAYLTAGLKPNSTMYFPVVQECEHGVNHWSDIPQQGQRDHGHTKFPAPGLKLTPAP